MKSRVFAILAVLAMAPAAFAQQGASFPAVKFCEQFAGNTLGARVAKCVLPVPSDAQIVAWIQPVRGLPTGADPITASTGVLIFDTRKTEVLIGNPSTGGYAAHSLWKQYAGAGTDRVFNTAFEIVATDGGDGDPGHAEAAPLFVGCKRTSGARPCYTHTVVFEYYNHNNKTQGFESDGNNLSGVDDSLNNDSGNQNFHYVAVSGGLNKISFGFATRATRPEGRILTAFDAANFSTFGFSCTQDSAAPAVNGPCFISVPSSDGTAATWIQRNHANNKNVFSVLQNGQVQLANDVAIAMANTDGSFSALDFVGGDNTRHIRAGSSTNGVLEDHAGNNVLQWNPGGITVTGQVQYSSLKTAAACASATSPAACGNAPVGFVTIAAAATTKVVNTGVIGANSQVLLTEDSSLGTALGVTCNTTAGRTYTVTARTAGTSFTITASGAPAANPACLSYHVEN